MLPKRKVNIRIKFKRQTKKENEFELLFLIFTLLYLASNISKEIHQVNEIKGLLKPSVCKSSLNILMLVKEK